MLFQDSSGQATSLVTGDTVIINIVNGKFTFLRDQKPLMVIKEDGQLLTSFQLETINLRFYEAESLMRLIGLISGFHVKETSRKIFTLEFKLV